ncbi:MAG: S26 family signal peptidase [Halorhabdus sp.]
MSDPSEERGASEDDGTREQPQSSVTDEHSPPTTELDGSPGEDATEETPGPESDDEHVRTPATGDESRQSNSQRRSPERSDAEETDSRRDVSAGTPLDNDASRGPSPTRSKSEDRSRQSVVLQYLFDVASSVFIVATVGILLFTASGVWPPLVAIESGSMEPHIQKGDLVFIMDEHRFSGPGAHGTSGIVTARQGQQTGYRTFTGYGDVIVYHPDGSETRTPIIHRAMYWVEEGENWCRAGNPEYTEGLEPTDQQCIAEHAGFITKGDNSVTNDQYDQAMGLSGPVKPAWVMGTAELRVPILGEVRLLSGQASTGIPDRPTDETNGSDRSTRNQRRAGS